MSVIEADSAILQPLTNGDVNNVSLTHNEGSDSSTDPKENSQVKEDLNAVTLTGAEPVGKATKIVVEALSDYTSELDSVLHITSSTETPASSNEPAPLVNGTSEANVPDVAPSESAPEKTNEQPAAPMMEDISVEPKEEIVEQPAAPAEKEETLEEIAKEIGSADANAISEGEVNRDAIAVVTNETVPAAEGGEIVAAEEESATVEPEAVAADIPELTPTILSTSVPEESTATSEPAQEDLSTISLAEPAATVTESAPTDSEVADISAIAETAPAEAVEVGIPASIPIEASVQKETLATEPLTAENAVETAEIEHPTQVMELEETVDVESEAIVPEVTPAEIEEDKSIEPSAEASPAEAPHTALEPVTVAAPQDSIVESQVVELSGTSEELIPATAEPVTEDSPAVAVTAQTEEAAAKPVAEQESSSVDATTTAPPVEVETTGSPAESTPTPVEPASQDDVESAVVESSSTSEELILTAAEPVTEVSPAVTDAAQIEEAVAEPAAEEEPSSAHATAVDATPADSVEIETSTDSQDTPENIAIEKLAPAPASVEDVATVTPDDHFATETSVESESKLPVVEEAAMTASAAVEDANISVEIPAVVEGTIAEDEAVEEQIAAQPILEEEKLVEAAAKKVPEESVTVLSADAADNVESSEEPETVAEATNTEVATVEGAKTHVEAEIPATVEDAVVEEATLPTEEEQDVAPAAESALVEAPTELAITESRVESEILSVVEVEGTEVANLAAVEEAVSEPTPEIHVPADNVPVEEEAVPTVVEEVAEASAGADVVEPPAAEELSSALSSEVQAVSGSAQTDDEPASVAEVTNTEVAIIEATAANADVDETAPAAVEETVAVTDENTALVHAEDITTEPIAEEKVGEVVAEEPKSLSNDSAPTDTAEPVLEATNSLDEASQQIPDNSAPTHISSEASLVVEKLVTAEDNHITSSVTEIAQSEVASEAVPTDVEKVAALANGSPVVEPTEGTPAVVSGETSSLNETVCAEDAALTVESTENDLESDLHTAPAVVEDAPLSSAILEEPVPAIVEEHEILIEEVRPEPTSEGPVVDPQVDEVTLMELVTEETSPNPMATSASQEPIISQDGGAESTEEVEHAPVIEVAPPTPAVDIESSQAEVADDTSAAEQVEDNSAVEEIHQAAVPEAFAEGTVQEVVTEEATPALTLDEVNIEPSADEVEEAIQPMKEIFEDYKPEAAVPVESSDAMTIATQETSVEPAPQEQEAAVDETSTIPSIAVPADIMEAELVDADVEISSVTEASKETIDEDSLLSTVADIERPTSPWTPSFQVTTVGRGASPEEPTTDAADEIEPARAIEEKSEVAEETIDNVNSSIVPPPQLYIDQTSLEEPTEAQETATEEIPRPWTPSYSVHSQGSPLPAQAKLAEEVTIQAGEDVDIEKEEVAETEEMKLDNQDASATTLDASADQKKESDEAETGPEHLEEPAESLRSSETHDAEIEEPTQAVVQAAIDSAVADAEPLSQVDVDHDTQPEHSVGQVPQLVLDTSEDVVVPASGPVSEGLVPHAEERPASPSWVPSYSVSVQGSPAHERSNPMDEVIATSEVKPTAVEGVEAEHAFFEPPFVPVTEIEPQEVTLTAGVTEAKLLAERKENVSQDPLATLDISPPLESDNQERLMSSWTPSYSVTTQGATTTSGEIVLSEVEATASHAESAEVNRLEEIVTQDSAQVDDDKSEGPAPSVVVEVANVADASSEVFPTIQGLAETPKKVTLRLASLDENEAAAVNGSVTSPMNIPPVTGRSRLESTASSRFFPGAWFSPSKTVDETRASLEVAQGEFIAAKILNNPSIDEGPTVDQIAITEPVPEVEANEEPQSASSEQKRRWCVIM